jgi:hypothetical protein
VSFGISALIMPRAALVLPIVPGAAFTLRPQTVFVFSNGIPIAVKSVKVYILLTRNR